MHHLCLSTIALRASSLAPVNLSTSAPPLNMTKEGMASILHASLTSSAWSTSHLKNLTDKRFEGDILKEVEFKKFHEAKRRMRNFLLHTDMSDFEER